VEGTWKGHATLTGIGIGRGREMSGSLFEHHALLVLNPIHAMDMLQVLRAAVACA
jgi:hypothetical protein